MSIDFFIEPFSSNLHRTIAFSSFDYARVRHCSMPTGAKNPLITSAKQCGPFSDLNWRGALKRPKCCSKHSAVDCAVASAVTHISTQRVNVRTITRMYLLSGNGPTKSIIKHSIGVYVDVVKPWSWEGIYNILIFSQRGHWSIKYLICYRWKCQTSFKSLKCWSVRSRPKLCNLPISLCLCQLEISSQCKLVQYTQLVTYKW